ncbi:desmoplakin-A-like [Halichoeres trimaculatus]|uniref:desmoplakin-A-like n=1 Tax=Halichoeres trimaculatus TaxID=147232 RepID=UPI003D9E6129
MLQPKFIVESKSSKADYFICCSASNHGGIHQRAVILQSQCQEYLKRAEYAIKHGGMYMWVAKHNMAMAKERIEQLKGCAMDLRRMGQPNDNVVQMVEMCKDRLKWVQSLRPLDPDLPTRSLQNIMRWIAQQKHLIKTASWGDDPAAIEQQMISHQRFHSSLQRNPEVERARDELLKKGDKGNLHALDQEWDSLQKLSFGRTQQLQELQQIIQEMSKEIMWVNDREEEELVFDWGDKNIDQYIPRKQESYSKLLSSLEHKERDLKKLKGKVDTLLKNNHPAADKIEAYKDTLQTQWSWLLQITKCIDTHLKENSAYSQFFKEANETYGALQKEHERVHKVFTCDKNTPLEDLLRLLKELEREKEKILEHKRQVQHLVNRSKNIVRLKPRNPEEKSSSQVIVKALCDFKQNKKIICKNDEAILKDNSQRSKWNVTGPGGLDMTIPSVCLIALPPNPIGISLANKNDQYYETILSIWNQLYINLKSLVAWQYCLLDIKRINSLRANMRPEEYRQIIKSLEIHFEEFKVSCVGSEMFGDEEKRSIKKQLDEAKGHYKEEEVVKVPCSPFKSKPQVPTSRSLTELHALRLRLDGAEDTLSQHVHICLGDDGVNDCGLKISQLELMQKDVDMMREEYLRLKDRIMKELEGMKDSDKAQFLRSEIGVIDQRLNSLEGSSSAYMQRLRALRDMLESVARGEDIVKVYEERLTEKETTSLTPSEVEEYILVLKKMKSDLDLKKDVLSSMEAELAKASHWNGQVGAPFHRCDMMLSKYTEQVNLLSDRWKRILGQIDTRVQDLETYKPQLQQYKQTSSSLSDWIDATRKTQNNLQTTKIESIEALQHHINSQKALNAEIKAKRGTLDSVLKDNDVCVVSVKDYETDLNSYTSGLKTLLNIPIKRTMLKSPSMDLNLEATQLQTRYMELLTPSSDYYKYLGELLKNMELRTKEQLRLEEELRTARHDKEEALRSQQGHSEELSSQITALQLQLQTSECSNVDYRNLVSELSSEREKLKLEAEKIQKQATEMTTNTSIQSKYNDIVSERDDLLQKLKMSENRDLKRLEDELNRNKQRLQEEIDRLKRDVAHWKDQYVSKQELIKQYDSDKDRLERDKNSLKSEIDRLMRELRELEDSYKNKMSVILIELKDTTVLRQSMEAEQKKPKETPALDASSVIFDGVRKKVTADKLLDLGILDEPTFDQLAKRHKTVPEVSADKKTNLKGTGPIAGVMIEGQKGPGTGHGPLFKMTLTEAKKDGLLSSDIVDLLLDAQAATGHIIDPRTNQKYTVDEACDLGVVDDKDRRRLLAAESAAVGFGSPTTDKRISVFEAMRKGTVDKKTALRLLQAQEATGGILDPSISVFLPVDMAIERNLIDDSTNRAIKENSKQYIDPETEEGVTYRDLKQKCKVELNTGLLLLPVHKRLDSSKLVFEGVRKTVTAKELLDCGVLDKLTFKDLEEGKKTVPEVSLDKKVFLKGTGSIAGVAAGPLGKMSFSEAKRQKIIPSEIADLLLDAQAATGHIIDPVTNQKLTVDEACARGMVDSKDLDRLWTAEAAAVGYKDSRTTKSLSVAEAMKKGLVDKKTALCLLQAQECAGGILDPNLSVFLSKDMAIQRNILDSDLSHALNKQPEYYLDPDTQEHTSYVSLKKKCKADPRTGLLLLPEPNKPVPNESGKSRKNTRIKTRVIIIDPETNKKMTVHEAHGKGLIDRDTFIKLSEQESEGEEITITASDGSTRYRIVDKKTGRKYDLTEMIEKGVISQSELDRYKSHAVTLTQFVHILSSRTKRRTAAPSANLSLLSSPPRLPASVSSPPEGISMSARCTGTPLSQELQRPARRSQAALQSVL